MTSEADTTNTEVPRLSDGEARELMVVAGMACSVVGARADEVDDLAQIVVEKLYRKWDEPHVVRARSRSRTSWQGYVVQTARNALKDVRRKDSRATDRERRATSGADGEPLPSRPGVVRYQSVDRSDIEQYLARLALIDTIHEAPLSEREQEVLSLHLLEGLSTREMASRLHLSARRVRELRLDGLDKLRRHVARQQLDQS